jgi:hypothetical protein
VKSSPARRQHSLLSRKKMSDSHKGLNHTDETKAKIAAYRRGRKHSLETIEKIRAARAAASLGSTCTAEHCGARRSGVEQFPLDGSPS